MPTFENPGLPTFADTSAAALATFPSEIQRIDVDGRRFIRFDAEPAYQPKFRSQDRYTASGDDVIDEANGGWWGAQYTNTVPISYIAPDAGKGGIDNAHIANAIAALSGTGLKTLDLEGRNLRVDNSSPVFPLAGFADIVLEGSGGSINFVGDTRADYPINGGAYVNALGCDGLLLSNLTLNFEKLPWCQGFCTATGTGTVDIEVDPEFDPVSWEGQDAVAMAIQFDPVSGTRIPGSFPYWNQAASPEGSGSLTTYMEFNHLSGSTYRLEGTDIHEDRFVVGGYYLILHHRVGMRALSFLNSKRVRAHNVFIESTCGSGIGAQNCEAMDFSGFRFVRRGNLLITVPSDIFHLINGRGKAILSGGRAEGCIDDVWNNQTPLIDITTLIPNSTGFDGTIAINSAAWVNQDYRPGDIVRYFGPDGVPIAGESAIASYTPSSPTVVTLQMEAPLPQGVDATSFAVVISAQFDVSITSSYFGRCSAHGLVVQSDNAVIAGNEFEHVERQAVDMSGYGAVFEEGNRGSRIIVADNIAQECGNGKRPAWERDKAVFEILGRRIDTLSEIATPVFEHVEIDNNRVIGSAIGGFHVANCITPTVSRNSARDVCRSPNGSDGALSAHPFSARHNSDMRAFGNTSDSSGSGKFYVSNLTGTTILGENPGLDISNFWTLHQPPDAYTFGGAAPTSLGISTNNSRWMRKDSRVIFECQIIATPTLGAATGEFRVKLPFPVRAGSPNVNIGPVSIVRRIALDSTRTFFTVRAEAGTDYATLQQNGSNTTTPRATTIADFNDAVEFRLSFRVEYEV